MAEKKKKKNKDKEKERWYEGLKEETRYSVWGVLFLGFSLFLVLAIFGKAGLMGNYVHSVLKLLLGQAVFLAPTVTFFAAISLFASYRPNLLVSSLIGATLIFVSSLALIEIVFSGKTGGYVGFLVALPFLRLVDFWASLILFSAIFMAGCLIMFNAPLSLPLLKGKRKQQSFFEGEEDEKEEDVPKPESDFDSEKPKPDSGFDEGSGLDNKENNFRKNSRLASAPSAIARFNGLKFQPPSLDFLEADKGKPSAGDIKANANVIRRTLQNFGIEVVIDEIRIGPSVTQYALKPAEGIKLSRIIALNNDLSLALASHPIRIEAPIPGKSLVGIEVPNKTASLVGLHHLIKEADFQESSKSLLLALGRNVAGRPVYAALTKMPHLLIAGATGSGKSVGIHALIMSLLYKHAPWELKLLLIDPKRVELDMYNSLPHLLSPVITDAKKAIRALKWATKEMERRYDVLLSAGARDIHSYHQKQKKDGMNMPFIVIVVDELADIMATYPREFESSIVRLAQMSRAVGIHLVVSTQRPSVEVITGLIKANITSRVAFQVASQVDSRTILDMAGAERLLGNGDMLFLSGDSSKPRRIQGSFVSEREVRSVVECLSKQYEDLEFDNPIMGDGGIKQVSIFDENSDESDDSEEDDLYEDARLLVIEAKKASSSYLQRKLRVGYARAARLLDMLEERGVVGPADGSRPRDVLISKEL